MGFLERGGGVPKAAQLYEEPQLRGAIEETAYTTCRRQGEFARRRGCPSRF